MRFLQTLVIKPGESAEWPPNVLNVVEFNRGYTLTDGRIWVDEGKTLRITLERSSLPVTIVGEERASAHPRKRLLSCLPCFP